MYTPATTHHSLAFAISEVHCKVHCETGIFRSKSDACDLMSPLYTHTQTGEGGRGEIEGGISLFLGDSNSMLEKSEDIEPGGLLLGGTEGRDAVLHHGKHVSLEAL